MNAIAVRIKQVMVGKGLFQKVVAKRAGFTDQQLCDMFNGRKIIRAEYLPPLAKALGVDVCDFFATDGTAADGREGA